MSYYFGYNRMGAGVSLVRSGVYRNRWSSRSLQYSQWEKRVLDGQGRSKANRGESSVSRRQPTSKVHLLWRGLEAGRFFSLGKKIPKKWVLQTGFRIAWNIGRIHPKLLAVDTEAWFIKYNGLLKQLICYICQKQDKDFEIQKPRYLFWSERTLSLSKDHFYPFESWSTQ